MQQDEPLSAIAIGASSGGVEALLAIAAALPRHVPAIVLVTQHIGTYRSILPDLMRARGPNHAMHPLDGDRPLPGTIYIAPPDHHLLVEDGRLRLFRGPKENHCRPAIDPMFRSVAVAFRERAVGVVLTGFLDDGTAGLKAIKACGGTAIVQDPAQSPEPSMPRSALAHVEVDLCLRVEEMVPAFLRILGSRPGGAAGSVPDAIRREGRILEGENAVENLSVIATPSALTCPECGGGFWEMNDAKPLRWRCHTGHAYSARSLEHAQSASVEQALWSGARALQEREILLRRLALDARGEGDDARAESAERQAERAGDQAAELARLIEEGRGGA